MPTIYTLTQPAVPISPDTLGAEVYERFDNEPDTLVIPVVEDDRPVGLVERNAFLVRLGAEYGRALYGGRPIRLLMDPEPVSVEAAMDISLFCESMLAERASSLMRGFIVTDQGRYLGVGTVLALLQATSVASRARADELSRTVRSLDVAQTQAHASAHAKAQFLGVMSHELRTPMNGVLAVAELLRRQPLGPDAQAYVQTIIDSSETLLRILSDALDLSRAEGGELELTSQSSFLNEIMDDVQALWTPRAAQDGVSLMAGYDGDPDLAVEIDVVRLKQVFNNLIGNALKYARNGVVEASLKAAASADGVRLEARVRDNGRGDGAERLENAFEPFAEGAGHGSGLGLAICRQIVERMGGRIWAERNPGEGSTFGFEITAPRAEIVRQGAASNVTELTELQLSTEPHILIVDDNGTNRVVAQALCEMFGCTSECAEDGQEAIEMAKTRHFDMILMDIKMPRMDGVQATQAIRALPGPAKDTPIVALTANADPDDAKHYLSIGMAAVVEKPIKPERLRQAMTVALNGAEEAVVEAKPKSKTKAKAKAGGAAA
jgi:signal transduction histidine kinase/AmiR/NasT family two-component response regulator